LTAEITQVSMCKRNLTVEVSQAELDQEINVVAREYARNIQIPGFRPGKVPLNIVKQRYANDIRKEAVQNLIARSWKEALQEHGLNPLAEPTLEKLEDVPGGPLKFVIAFEVLPDFQLENYKGIPISIPPVEVSEEDMNRALEVLREQHAQFVPLEEDEARDGHRLTVTMDGQFEDSGKTLHEDNVELILGDQQTISDFSANLRGSKVGETRTFEIQYPTDYHRKNFAGKKVRYTVQVKEIKEKQLPVLNDEFARDLGAENLESLKSRIHDELVTEQKQNAEKKARRELLDIVVQRHSLEVPECMVQKELEAYIDRLANELAYRGVDPNQASIDWDKVYEEARPNAEIAVRQAILLDAIARQEGIEVTEEEVDAELQKICEGTNRSAAALRAQLEKEERIKAFEQRLRRNKALDFIYRNANIT